MDWSLVEAAQDLYASRLRVFFAAILPQTLPGLSVAVILTFVPAMSVFVVSDMLGGAKHWLIGNLIQHQFGPGRNIPYGAALSLILILLTLGGVTLYRRSGRSVEIL
jgi:spermidine/putrescine transport system permease protein